MSSFKLTLSFVQEKISLFYFPLFYSRKKKSKVRERKYILPIVLEREREREGKAEKRKEKKGRKWDLWTPPLTEISIRV